MNLKRRAAGEPNPCALCANEGHEVKDVLGFLLCSDHERLLLMIWRGERETPKRRKCKCGRYLRKNQAGVHCSICKAEYLSAANAARLAKSPMGPPSLHRCEAPGCGRFFLRQNKRGRMPKRCPYCVAAQNLHHESHVRQRATTV